MFKIVYDHVFRVTKGIFCAVAAGWVIWKGNTYSDTMSMTYSLVPPVMCALAGMSLILTGLAIVFSPPHGEIPDE
jgi:hypothetical protein